MERTFRGYNLGGLRVFGNLATTVARKQWATDRYLPSARLASCMLLASTLLVFALADCDDIAAAPSGDLFLACHSPSDKFTVPVIGQKTGNDEMDGYVIRLKKDTHEIVYVTRMGGSAYDSASRLAVDAEGNAWVAGLPSRPISP